MGVKDRATQLGMKVMQDIMNDPAKADKLAQAMGAYQRGRESVKDGQERMLHGMGLPTQADMARLGRRLSKLRKRQKAISGRLDAVLERLG